HRGVPPAIGNAQWADRGAREHRGTARPSGTCSPAVRLCSPWPRKTPSIGLQSQQAPRRAPAVGRIVRPRERTPVPVPPFSPRPASPAGVRSQNRCSSWAAPLAVRTGPCTCSPGTLTWVAAPGPAQVGGTLQTSKQSEAPTDVTQQPKLFTKETQLSLNPGASSSL
ncbi:hypothetical protein MC885_020497, partial [Smutsia gigantea]